MNARHILSFDRLIRNGRFAPVLTLSGLLAATLVAAPPTDPGVEAPPAAAADDATLTENPKAPNTDQFDLIFEDAAQQQRVEELIEGLNSAHNASNSARYKYSVRYTDGNRRKLETVLASSEPLAYRQVRKKHPDADSILLVETRKDGDRVDRRRRKPNSGRTIDGPLAGQQGGGNLDQSNQQDQFLAAEMRRQRFAELDRAARLGWLEQWTFADDETRRRMTNQLKATQLAALRGLAAVPSKMKLAVLRMLDRFRYSIIPGTGKTGGQIKAEILRKGGSLIPKAPVSAFTEMIDRMHEQNIQNILRGKTFQDINSRMQQAMIELAQRRQMAAANRAVASGVAGGGDAGSKTTFSQGNTHKRRSRNAIDGRRARHRISDSLTKGKSSFGSVSGASGASDASGASGGIPGILQGEGGAGISQGTGIPVSPSF